MTSAALIILLIVLFNKQIGSLLNTFKSWADTQSKNITLSGDEFFNNVTNDDFMLDAQNRLILNPGTSPPPPPPETWDFISISNPSNYVEADILRFADLKIEMQNWATINGGKMTPYPNGDGTYRLDAIQENLISQLAVKGQNIFWIGITGDHVNIFGTPQVYIELCNAIDAYIVTFNKLSLPNAYIGVYVPALGQDEIITNLRPPNYDRQQQYDFAEATRAAVKVACGASWSKVMWMNTGQDNYMGYQLTNDAQSYWAHHTNVSLVSDVEDLVYNNNYTIMSSAPWKTIWGGFKKLAWTDVGLVTGAAGSRQFTALGLAIFN